MGINGLNTFLKEKVPDCIKEVHFSDFKGQKVAIDTSIYFYKFLYKNDRYIEGFFQQIYRLMSNGILPVYIFDGIPPPEKKEILEQRKEKKLSLNKSIQELECKINSNNLGETTLEEKELLEKLKKKNIYVKKSYYDNLKHFLDLIGIPYLQCHEEADLLCNTLVIKNKVDLIMSDDMDILVGGAKHILRNFNINNNKILFYDMNCIQKALGLTEAQWVNLCVLSGCDYCPRIHGVGVKNAYKFIQKHTLDEIFAILSYKAPIDYIEKFNRSRELFLKIIENETTNTVEFNKNESKPELLKFIKEYTNLTDKQIQNRLKIINQV